MTLTFRWSLERGLESEVSSSGDERPPELVCGQRFADLLLVEQLGEGESAQVFLARDPSGREVVLKVLRELDPTLAQRMHREGALLETLRAVDGIVPVLRVGDHAGRSFLVFEALPGATPLEDAWDALDLDAKLHALAEAATVLGRVHAVGVVHRDVKPSNLLLSGGKTWVIDFGLARGRNHPTLTVSGALVGTPRYMSPEQLLGQRVDARADVFALGVVLYRALSGAFPFDAPGLAALMEQLERCAPVPPSELDPATPPALEAVCLRALARAPEERFSDGAAFARALARARAPRSPSPRTPLAWVALALGSVVLLGSVWALRGAPRGGGGGAVGAVASASVPAPRPPAPPPPRTLAPEDLARSPQELVDRGLAYLLTARYHGALPLYLRLTSIAPEDPRGWTGLAWAQAETGRARLAEAALRRALEILDPGMESGVVDYVHGLVLMRLGRDAEAREALDASLAHTPESWRARLARAEVSLRLGAPDRARVDLEAVLQVDAAYATEYHGRGVALQELGRPAEAELALTRALDLDPGIGRAYCERARARAAVGSWRGALDDLDAALQLDPSVNVLASFQFTRGVALQGLGAVDRARDAFGHAQRLGVAPHRRAELARRLAEVGG